MEKILSITEFVQVSLNNKLNVCILFIPPTHHQIREDYISYRF